jgi:RNA polymerase sigma factor (sigma-70 family)
VRSPELAEEVAQCVFSDLARSADKLERETILTAWLYQVTRRTAINVVRAESRRQRREQIALDVSQMNSNSSEWTEIEPLLDEAMEALDSPDRTAVLLRYFEDKSLREVGKLLGTSEDAAQKRVSRALDHLRGELERLRENAQMEKTDPTAVAMKSWLERVNQVEKRVEQTPGAKIPEFQYLTEQDWLNVAKDDLNTDEDYRRALSALRNAAENTFILTALRPALNQYGQANNGQFPSDISQLTPFFNPPVEYMVMEPPLASKLGARLPPKLKEMKMPFCAVLSCGASSGTLALAEHCR